ncbi:MAG: type II toxin-antitoxin system HigB family toxin [Ginsengibacter sp.]
MKEKVIKIKLTFSNYYKRVHFQLSHCRAACGRCRTPPTAAAPVGVPTNRRQIEMHPYKRKVFNINENKYRLIVDIEFHLQIIFIVWIGTHAEYDKIDAKTIVYDNAR